ncbi:galactokinase family protein [Corynebacterium epidermidicanis]|uniref:Galactokinase n=1 Tax=Corynebacterium epidermidicanis TaxID=1050174 RepID=A0A0G3GSN5_9CORY|nr:galactokinase family protein [Corynebacterium epidermidicanis]AKK03595.1 galactokinase [Corynebacterium epidermidicanis]
MPEWPIPEQNVSERALQLHARAYGESAEFAGIAPATWKLIGDHIDHIGGLVVCAIANLHVAVVASKRNDDTIMVTAHQRGLDLSEESFTESVTLSQLATQAANQPQDDHAPTRPLGGLATRLGGVAWMLVHRQFLSRDTAGFNITVVSDIPSLAGLGADVACETAFAIALAQLTEHKIDPPTRARLSEYCAAAAAIFSENPPVSAQYATALRGHHDAFTIVDYSDGSVTSAPKCTDLQTFLAIPPAECSEQVDEILRRQHFARRAEKAFGVDCLRRLPDAKERVLQWLMAMYQLEEDARGPLPTASEAEQWLTFYDAELQRAQRAAAALRARKTTDVMLAVNESENGQTTEFGLQAPTCQAVVQLALSRGALAARAAASGYSSGVIAHVAQAKARNFQADLADDGFVVVALESGECAEPLSLN